MLYKNEQLYRISTEEYFYLTENFTFVDANKLEESVKYLMYNRRKKLIDTVRLIMENELNEIERNMAIDYWYNKMSIGDIAEKYHISRSAFYRGLDVIKNKLITSLKYVLIYDEAIAPPSVEEIKMNVFMGEQIGN